MSCRKASPDALACNRLCASGKKEERTNRLVEIEVQIARVFGNAHDFELAAGSGYHAAEMFADRIFVLEKLLRKRFVDDSHVPRSRRILLGDAASSIDRISDDVKVSRRNAIPDGEVVIFRPAEPDAHPPRRPRPNVAA